MANLTTSEDIIVDALFRSAEPVDGTSDYDTQALTWLNRTYTETLGDNKIIGGAKGMLEGFESIFADGADLVISEEASDYRPESEWLVQQLNLSGERWNIHSAENYQNDSDRSVYRFFELFDLPNLPGMENWLNERPLEKLT